MKQFEIAPGGCTDYRHYRCERVIYVLSGEGALKTPAGNCGVTSGDAALLQGGEKHQVFNNGTDTLSFPCITPTEVE